MEEFRPHRIAAVIKTDKKDMLLSNKDPHLSHLFEHGCPNTPNSVAADNLAQSSIDVDGNYTEEASEQDYTLFQGQSSSFMPGYVPESSQLMMDVNCAESCNNGGSVRGRCEDNDENNNSTQDGDGKLFPNQPNRCLQGNDILKDKGYVVQSHSFDGDRNSNAAIEKVSVKPQESDIDMFKYRFSNAKKGDQHRPPNLLISLANQAKSREVEKSQLLSPPADHYNMQILAQTAQQQQQLLQQQQQQRQQELFGRGSSSAALQQFARMHEQNKEQGVEYPENPGAFLPKSSAYSYFSGGDGIKAENLPKSGQLSLNALNQSGVLAHLYSPSSQSLTKQQQAPVSSTNYSSWTMPGRTSPDYERGHIRDLSFGSQDSPILSLQSNEFIKSSLKLQHPKVVAPHPATMAAVEPELKSPLDHPVQMGANKNRFFSSDSGQASGEEQRDGEAPLNENDKKAVAAIGELMEMSENIPPAPTTSVPANFASTKPSNLSAQTEHLSASSHSRGTPLSFNVLQMHELIRNTPPPPYEPSSLMPGTGALHFPTGLLAVTPPSGVIAMNSNSDVKQEPHSPNKASRQFYVTNDGQYKPNENCNTVRMAENQAKFLPCPNGDLGSRNTEMAVGNATIAPNLPMITDPYLVHQQMAAHNIHVEKSSSVLPTKTPAARSRRTSSSGSTRRKSESGGLTCGICGHAFRSTPALNGHMRVHSTPEKKQNKEERLARTASHDSAKASPHSKPPPPSTQPQAYYDGSKLQQTIPLPQDSSIPFEGNVRVLPCSLPGEGDPAATRSHNGLLTMASAACYLKTEGNKGDYLHPTTVLPPSYLRVPHTLLIHPPAVVPTSYPVDALNPTEGDGNAPTVKLEAGQVSEPHGVNYSQFYAAAATPFQQGLPFSNFGFFANVPPQVPKPLLPEQGVFPNNQPDMRMLPTVEQRDNMVVNSQAFVNQQEKPMAMVNAAEPYSSQYEPAQSVETNSLCQLASIAVAAANREYVPEAEYQGDMGASFAPSEMQTGSGDPGNPANLAMMSAPINPSSQQECMSQEDVFPTSNMAAEASPLQSGHDPFIFPGDHRQNQQRAQYSNYNTIGGGIVTVNREPMVTWKDNVDTRSYSLLSSYDDPLMQEAVNVANPSKILPNSMMGGTPQTGGILSGARPFRQRHHSEGAHLIKNSQSNILKQILETPPPDRPTSCEKPPDRSTMDVFNPQAAESCREMANAYPNASDHGAGQTQANITEKKEEFWAEPKPVQKRIRRRRHSADSRLFLKPGLPTAARQNYNVGNLNKKTNLLRQERARRRPPPLVIPSSVNTFTTVPSSHPNFYQSHLHHRRRPSGDSVSSINGLNDKIPPYTPPPMLSPIRAGSGLYCTTPVTPMFNRQKSVDGGFSTIIEVDESVEDDEELVRSSEPKINIGSRFQAAIPKMRSTKPATDLRHNAVLVWSSRDVKTDNSAFKHVEQFMELSCSAVVPYGGSNKEYALDCIAQSKGDILSAVRRLIMRKHETISDKPFKNYSGAGKPWSTDEIKLFDCAMLEHRKDFFVISEKVKTRTTAECVDRYYHVVKRNRRRHRRPHRYRDSDHDEFSLLLADTLQEGKNATSSISTSSSDDDATLAKSKVSSDTELGWLALADSQNKSDMIPSSSQSSPSSISSSSHHAYPKVIKTHAARMQQGQFDTSSPIGSPVSTMSNDDQPSQSFSCPVCGKTFGKVKSRNAHMKTHGKQAQEKRRQREEEAARRREELASRHMSAAAQQRPSLVHQHPNFIHPAQAKLFPHSALQQAHADCSVPRFGGGM